MTGGRVNKSCKIDRESPAIGSCPVLIKILPVSRLPAVDDVG